MRIAYWKTEECSLNQLLVDLSRSAHLPSRLTQQWVRPYFLEPVWLGSKDSRVRWAGRLPKQQPEPLQRSLSQEPLQVVFQEMESTSVLQPTPLQKPVADLGFLNGGRQVPKAQGSRRRRRQGVWGGEGLFQKYFVSIFGLEIAYYGAFWCHVANISTLQSTYTQYTQSMNFNDTHVCIAALHLQGLKINCTTLKWLHEAGHAQTQPWTHALFSCQKLLEILVSMTW